MNTDPSRYIRSLKPGQRVLIKRGHFGGMQGVVMKVQTGGNETERTTEVRVDVRLPATTPRPVWSNGVAPVLFTNPTVDDLERI